MPQPLNPKTTGTPYELKILDIQNPGAGVYYTAVTVPNQKQATQAGIESPQVAALNNVVTALNTLKQSTQSASKQTGSADNHAAAKQDALKLLADFAKANPDNLTADQQKQLSDILAAQKDGKGVSQAQLNGLIDSLNGSIKSQYTEEVRATGNGPTLPNSSLYNIDPNNPNGYLVETDPAFANYKKWLSSDYMMQRLGLDPSNMHKRLGDGYYEQGLIRDQVMALTGRRFLGDYTTDDTMYQSLMDNGVTVAKAMNLRSGIALTAEQMAQLTTDIVWLVEQTITLKDGSKQTVLVPKVYVRSKIGDLKGDSSLIAARNIDMQFTGDLSNQGNIVAHNALRISANNLNNQNGGVIQGNFVQINTKNDLNNLGATLKANSAMAIDVGGKLNNSSTTYHTESQAGQSNAWRTGIDQIGQLYVGDGLKGKTDENGRPLTTLSIDVGGNATFNAGQLINQGGTSRLVAQGDVALNAVNTGYQINAIKDGNNYTKSGQTQDIGSVVASQGSTYIQSKGGSITGTAVTIHSEDGSSYLDANKDITLKEGRATSNLETASKTTDKGLLSRKTTQDRNSATSDEAMSGSVTGDRVVINAGNDIHLTATNAISQSGTTLSVGNNLTLDAAENRYSESSSHNEKKSGLFGNGGANFTLGTQKTANDNRTDSTTHTDSVVGTYNGNTVLTAGEHYQQTGSKVFAQNQTTDNPKDLNYGTTIINAKSANVTNTTATTESHNSQSQKTSGLTVGVSNSLIDQAQGINSLAKAGQTANSDQMKVMAGVAGFNKLRTLGKGAQAAADSLQKNGLSEAGLKGVGNTRIQATIGSQSSKSNQDSLSGKNEASTIDTNNLVLNIQGKGKDSDFVLTGSDLNVKGDLYNNVEGDVVYKAATGKGYERSSNKSSGYGVGVYADSKNSGFTVNANTAKGYGNGETTTNANSHVTVGGTTYQNIGGDLVLDGAVVTGDHMTGHIDGAILAKSRPDTATYTGKQTNAGFSADIGFNGVPQSVSVNAGGSKVNADYAAVKEQTGIAMNSSDVVVAKASRFDGAYFTTATPEANKTVFKEGVTTTDIQNHMNYKGDAINVGLGAGINPETQKVSPPGISGIGYGKDGDSQTSTTYGAVTGMAGKSDVTTANVSSLNETLENSFNKTAVEAQLGAQVQVSQAFDTERRSYRLEMAKDEEKLRKEAEEARKQGNIAIYDAKIKEADKQQEKMVLFDSITGAIYGPNSNGATGYVARAVAPQVSYQIGQYFKGTNGEGTAPHILAHGILAAAVSVATGNDPTTGALSAMGAEAAAPIVAKFLFGDKPISELTADEKATVSSITSLAGLGMGATTGDVGSAVSAGQVGRNAVDDNYLTAQEVKAKEAWLSTLAQCNGEKTYICDMARQNVLQLIAKDANTDLMLSVCESNPTSPYCRTERAKADASLKTYRTSDNKTLIRDLDVAQKKEYAESNGYFARLPTGEIKGWNPSKDRWDAYLQTTEGRLAQSTFTGLQLASGDYAFGVAASALSKSLSGFKVGATGAANETALANSIYKNVSGLSTTEARALDNYLVNSSKATTFSKPLSLEQQLAAIGQNSSSSIRYNNPQQYRAQLAKEAGIPSYIDFTKPNNIYGLNDLDIKTYFEINGYTVGPKAAPRFSGNARVYPITNHKIFNEFQFSPASPGSTHKGEYIKLTIKPEATFMGKSNRAENFIYIINPNTFKGVAKGDSKGNAYVFNQQGQIMKYDSNLGKYVVK